MKVIAEAENYYEHFNKCVEMIESECAVETDGTTIRTVLDAICYGARSGAIDLDEFVNELRLITANAYVEKEVDS